MPAAEVSGSSHSISNTFYSSKASPGIYIIPVYITGPGDGEGVGFFKGGGGEGVGGSADRERRTSNIIFVII